MSAVIANERQYRIAKAQLRRFEEALEAHDAGQRGADVDPQIHGAMRDATASEAGELRAQLAGYDDLRAGRVGRRTLHSLRELPVALIEARIAAHLTQRDLADRLAIPEQQIQRWRPAPTLASVSPRLEEIADALGLQIHETVTYAIPDSRLRLPL